MKKYVALIVALALLAAVGAGAALAQEAEGRTLREGKYIVGEDIEAGAYTLTCTATAGEQMKDAYGSLGGAFDKLDGGNNDYIGALLERRHYYFVPFEQDDAFTKPRSLVADLSLAEDALVLALQGRQLGPLLKS